MTIATIRPSAAWIGTINWPGRTHPTNDEMQIFGTSGLRENVVADFDEPPHMWVESDDYTICVPAWTGDRVQIERVDFWLEGTTVSVTQKTRSPRTGVYGFCITPQSRPGANGDAELYAWVKPVNGRGRLLKLPMVLNTDRTAGVVIPRDNVYVDSVNGEDNGRDGRDPSLPVKTITRAFAVLAQNTGAAAHSGIVHLRGAADHVIGLSFGGGTNTRMAEIRGQGKNLTRVTRTPVTTPGGENILRWGTKLLMWRDLHLDTTNVSQLYALNAPGAVVVYKDVKIAREGGAIGPVDKGYPAGGSGFELTRSNAFFRSQDGQTQHVLEVESTRSISAAGVSAATCPAGSAATWRRSSPPSARRAG